MDWIKEFFWATGMVGIPVVIFTVAIVWWAMRNGQLAGETDGKGIALKLKALAKKKGKNKGEPDKRDFIQKKWAKFGGGFYGVVAFYTYLVVEITELINMVINIGGFWAFIQHLDIGVLVSMLVNAIMNFVSAMIWPVYWSNKMHASRVWLWVLVAYAGYWLGLKAALQLQKRRQEAESSE